MNKIHIGLLVLLAAQLVGAFAALSGRDTGVVASTPLVANIATADRIVLAKGTAQVVLEKIGDIWRLPDFFNLPANTKTARVVEELSAITIRRAVSTSGAAETRFSVGEDSANQVLTLYANDALLDTLYFGEVPSFQNVFVRKGEETAIYKVEFNTFDLNLQAKDWFDRTLLAWDGADAVAITRDGVRLDKVDDAWPSTESAAITEWLAALTSLTVNDVWQGAFTASATFSVADDAGTEHTYEIGKTGDTALIRRSDRTDAFPDAFEISTATFDSLNASFLSANGDTP